LNFAINFTMPRGTGALLAEGAAKVTEYVRAIVFPTRVPTPKHVWPLATVRLLWPFSTIFELYFSGGQLCSSRQAIAVTTRQVQFPGCLHCMPSVSTHQCIAPGCACLAMLFVLQYKPVGRHNA